MTTWLKNYNEARPHDSLGDLSKLKIPVTKFGRNSKLCVELINGHLQHYARKSAVVIDTRSTGRRLQQPVK